MVFGLRYRSPLTQALLMGAILFTCPGYVRFVLACLIHVAYLSCVHQHVLRSHRFVKRKERRRADS